MKGKKLSLRDIEQIYALTAKWYDVWMNALEFLFLGKMRRELLREARGKVLEVGIGTGLNLKHYPTQCELIGIDYTKEMLAKAQKRAERLGKKVKLMQGDAQKMRFGKERFDTVVDTLGLCTYPNPIRALREMKRVCKKGGQILFLEHGKSSNAFVQRLQCWRAEKHYEQMGCRLLLNHEELIRRARLKIVKSERKFFGIFWAMKAGV